LPRSSPASRRSVVRQASPWRSRTTLSPPSPGHRPRAIRRG